MRASWRAALAITATCVFVGLSSVVAGPAHAAGTAATRAAASSRPAAARSAATYYSISGGLAGVAAASATNAWAVGYTGEEYPGKVLMLHWNGKAWSRVTSPAVLNGTTGALTAITVISATNAWAVGYTGGIGTGTDHTLLLHWNGSAWSKVTSPAPVTGGDLEAVTATAKSGWAVGWVGTNPNAPGCCAGTPLILRWNGSKWSRVTTKLGMGAGLNGVAVTSTNTAWAIGEPTAMITGILAKWNGSTWGWVSDPVQGNYHPLLGIAAGPGGTAFAVGTNNDVDGPPLSMKWTGKAWQAVTVSAPNGSGLNAVAFAPGGTAWAAGTTFPGTESTLIEKWNGKEWARVASPGRGDLDGLGFSSASNGWAVGTSGTDTLILHWNGTAWSASPPAPPPPLTGYSTTGALTAVAAASAGNAWAVGYAGTTSLKVLMVHWNGSKWARVTSPSVLTGAGALRAVTVVNATDAWAVGYTYTGSNPEDWVYHTLILHWNGSAWSQVTSPAPADGSLTGVTATASGGWAVGDVHPGGASYSPLILRLTGSTWSNATGSYGTHDVDDVGMTGVAVTSATTAWAVGDTQETSGLARWTGSAWTSEYSLFPLPNAYYFNAIAAGPGGTAFVVGTEFPNGNFSAPAAFSLRLTGSTWKKVPVSAPSGPGLNAVAFAPGGVAWAAGTTGVHTLMMRWTGSTWAQVASPSPGSANTVNGLGFPAANYGWAVGATGSGTLILHWNGSTWS